MILVHCFLKSLHVALDYLLVKLEEIGAVNLGTPIHENFDGGKTAADKIRARIKIVKEISLDAVGHQKIGGLIGIIALGDAAKTASHLHLVKIKIPFPG